MVVRRGVDQGVESDIAVIDRMNLNLNGKCVSRKKGVIRGIRGDCSSGCSSGVYNNRSGGVSPPMVNGRAFNATASGRRRYDTHEYTP